ncbi:MAG TPA: SMI1/KNR4 family protein, partial [Labilithrix sp.]
MSVRAMEETLGVKVPEDLRAFFGEEVPTFGGEAAEPLSTEEILAVDLPPLPIDFLPIAGNGAGDFLCARLGPHGDVLEMVAWKHDDWSDALPFGRTLAEALLLSLCSAGDDAPDAAALAWALAHAPAALADAIAHGPSLRDVLLDRGVGVESLGEPDADVHGSRTEIHSPLFQK